MELYICFPKNIIDRQLHSVCSVFLAFAKVLMLFGIDCIIHINMLRQNTFAPFLQQQFFVKNVKISATRVCNPQIKQRTIYSFGHIKYSKKYQNNTFINAVVWQKDKFIIFIRLLLSTLNLMIVISYPLFAFRLILLIFFYFIFVSNNKYLIILNCLILDENRWLTKKFHKIQLQNEQ